MKIQYILILLFALILTGCSHVETGLFGSGSEINVSDTVDTSSNQGEENRFDFSGLDPAFRFSAVIPESFEVEYVPSIQSLNIYDPSDLAESIRDKSQIFIRLFTASRFLTLSTVSILNQEDTTRLGRPAVRYEIVKKPGVANFASQPLWRNQQHELIDIRFSDLSPSTFFVYSFNPKFSKDQFEKFVDSIQFHNQKNSFVAPLDRFDERINKKPFGLYVTPTDSPVQPERFTGYHTAVDLEIFSDELDKDMRVKTICGGTLRSVQSATGYGGVIVQECLLENESISVVYGHVDIDTVSGRVGEYLTPGTDLVLLASNNSIKSGGERKHLHLGIYKGRNVNLRGYVDGIQDLDLWIDPQDIIK
jgi:hypothetical protein